MADEHGCVRWLRGVLCGGAALVLAACAPLPVAQPPGAATAGDAACRAEGSDASVCPPAVEGTAGAIPSRRARAARLQAPPDAPAVDAPPMPTEPPAEPPRESDQQGMASWYGPGLHGRRTASGERFDRYELTAAHRTLPFGTRVCVRSSVTGKTVVVRINDRGPFTGGRVIDLSQGAAQELGMTGLGIKPVELWLLGKDEEACPDALLDASALDDAGGDPDAATAPRTTARKSASARVAPKVNRVQTRRARR